YAFADAAGLRILRHDRAENEYVIQVIGNNRKVEGGLAAAVSKDGYYLTAGHVVKGNSPLLLVRNENGKLLQTKGRVVWRADDGRDLALIKSESRENCFPMALTPPATGDVVIAAGASGGDSAGV